MAPSNKEPLNVGAQILVKVKRAEIVFLFVVNPEYSYESTKLQKLFIKVNCSIPFINMDHNIHKSEVLKWKDKRTLTLVECQN